MERRSLEDLLVSEHFSCGTLTFGLKVLCREKTVHVRLIQFCLIYFLLKHEPLAGQLPPLV